MVRLSSASLSQYLVRRAVLSMPLLLTATGAIGCATPIPFDLPGVGVDGLGGAPNPGGGTPNFGGSPAVGGGDSSSASSVSAAGDTTSAGASSGGAISFGGGNSAGAATAAGGTAGVGAGTAGAGTAGAASAGAAAAAGGATSGGSCATAFAMSACLNLTVGSKVSAGGRNWICSDANCRNCDNTPACEPAMSGCPWGAVWTDNGGCT